MFSLNSHFNINNTKMTNNFANNFKSGVCVCVRVCEVERGGRGDCEGRLVSGGK